MDMSVGMPIEPITPINGEIDGLTSKSVKKAANDGGFEKIFKNALNLIDETNKLQLDAENLQTAYVTGESDDIIGLNMAQAKASTALSFTTQVTNKILNAYQEIMRISL
jgi:flagellar hook-basal body complex protein FliE